MFESNRILSTSELIALPKKTKVWVEDLAEKWNWTGSVSSWMTRSEFEGRPVLMDRKGCCLFLDNLRDPDLIDSTPKRWDYTRYGKQTRRAWIRKPSEQMSTLIEWIEE